MPLLETKGAASAQGFGLTLQQAAFNYIEDVFSTWLYTGNGSTQTITNGIDLSTKGGLVWIKNRSSAYTHVLVDTNRGTDKVLCSNNTNAEQTGDPGFVTQFNSNGFAIGDQARVNLSSSNFVSWTFRKQPKFFDVVTYTGNGNNAGQTINHNLGSIPGFIICKSTSATGDWAVCARTGGASSPASSITYATGLSLNSTGAALYSGTLGDFPTATTFSTAGIFTNAGSYPNVNGVTYVAYLFAHDAGGFGLTGTDNVISCGGFTTNSSGLATVTLGYEPQFILFKTTDVADSWRIADTMRGWNANGDFLNLKPNTSDAEGPSSNFRPTSTGFEFIGAGVGGSFSYIYIAIRRGPMKTPTTGTSVYNAIARTGTGATATVSGVGFSPDMVLAMRRDNHPGQYNVVADRLRGPVNWLGVNSTEQEYNNSNMFSSFTMNGFVVGSEGSVNNSLSGIINWNFLRAPGFFDVVCYTGTGSSSTSFSHNLGVAPELIISKTRSGSTSNWIVTSNFTSTNYRLTALNLTIAADTFLYTDGASISAQPTSTTLKFTGGVPAVNDSGATYVAYLFASCPGVSKVGSYTGTGNTLQVDCGFTGGARFVLIKRTDSSGDWYVWDSARGIVSGNDPYLLLNSAGSEQSGTDWVDTHSPGFELSNSAGNLVNTNGGTYIFLAIA